MKKCFSILLAVLVFTAPMEARALEAANLPGIPMENGRNEAFISMVCFGNVPFLLAGSGKLFGIDMEDLSVYPIQVENKNPEWETVPNEFYKQLGVEPDGEWEAFAREVFQGIQILIHGGDTLYGLNSTSGALYAIEASGGTAALHGVCQLDLTAPQKDSGIPQIHSAAVLEGGLYASLSWDEMKSGFFQFDLSSGARTQLESSRLIQQLERLPNGQLLLLEGFRTSTGWGWQIDAFDSSTGERKTLYNQNSLKNVQSISGIAADPSGERILLHSGNRIVAVDPGGETETVAFLPSSASCCDAPTPSVWEGMAAERYRVDTEPDYLFMLAGSYLPNRRNINFSRESAVDFQPMGLRLFKDLRPQLVFEGTVVIINPYSKNKEAARLYLDYYAKHYDDATKAALLTGAGPVEFQMYSSLKSAYGSLIKDAEGELSKDGGENKRDIQARIDGYRKDLKAFDLIQWEVTQEYLEDYQAALAGSDIYWLDKSLDQGAETRIWQQYTAGALDGTAFVESLNDLYRRIVDEG